MRQPALEVWRAPEKRANASARPSLRRGADRSCVTVASRNVHGLVRALVVRGEGPEAATIGRRASRNVGRGATPSRNVRRETRHY